MQPAAQSQTPHRSNSVSSDDGDIDSSIVVVSHAPADTQPIDAPVSNTPVDTPPVPDSPISEVKNLLAALKQHNQALCRTIESLNQDKAALQLEVAQAREDAISAAAAAAAEISVLQQRIQHLSDSAQPLNPERASAQLPVANEKQTVASRLLKRLLQMDPLLLSLLLLLLAVVPALQHQHHSSIIASLNQDKAALQLEVEQAALVHQSSSAVLAAERAELQADLLKARELNSQLSDKVGVLEGRLQLLASQEPAVTQLVRSTA
jgi:hypothetical protein